MIPFLSILDLVLIQIKNQIGSFSIADLDNVNVTVGVNFTTVVMSTADCMEPILEEEEDEDVLGCRDELYKDRSSRKTDTQ